MEAWIKPVVPWFNFDPQPYLFVSSWGISKSMGSCKDLMLTAGLGFIALRDANHVVKAEVYLMAKARTDTPADAKFSLLQSLLGSKPQKVVNLK